MITRVGYKEWVLVLEEADVGCISVAEGAELSA